MVLSVHYGQEERSGGELKSCRQQIRSIKKVDMESISNSWRSAISVLSPLVTSDATNSTSLRHYYAGFTALSREPPDIGTGEDGESSGRAIVRMLIVERVCI